MSDMLQGHVYLRINSQIGVTSIHAKGRALKNAESGMIMLSIDKSPVGSDRYQEKDCAKNMMARFSSQELQFYTVHGLNSYSAR